MARAPHLVLVGGDGGRSGVPRHIEQICRMLIHEQAPYRITVVSEPDAGGYAFTHDLSIRHVELDALRSSADPRRIITGYRALKAALGDDPPDILWAHARLSVILTRLLPRGSARLIVTFHGSPFLGRSRARGVVMRGFERPMARFTRPHSVVFLSDLDRHSFAGINLARHTTHVIPNVATPVPAAPMTPSSAPTLVMTTRDSPQKNLDAAADIFAQMPDSTRLVLLGIGTQSPALKARFASRLGPEALARVSFCGPVDDVLPHLRSAHGYLMTSRYEGMSLGALEAFSVGLPVFMPDVGGRREILSAHPMGALIDPQKPKAAAAIILPILSAFQTNPDANAARISAAYNGAFCPDDWSKAIRRLLAHA